MEKDSNETKNLAMGGNQLSLLGTLPKNCTRTSAN